MEDQKAIQRQPQVATSAVVCDEPAKCAECGRNLPGHRIDCKTGNDRAKAYQDKLERRYRARRSHTR